MQQQQSNPQMSRVEMERMRKIGEMEQKRRELDEVRAAEDKLLAAAEIFGGGNINNNNNNGRKKSGQAVVTSNQFATVNGSSVSSSSANATPSPPPLPEVPPPPPQLGTAGGSDHASTSAGAASRLDMLVGVGSGALRSSGPMGGNNGFGNNGHSGSSNNGGTPTKRVSFMTATDEDVVSFSRGSNEDKLQRLERLEKDPNVREIDQLVANLRNYAEGPLKHLETL